MVEVVWDGETLERALIPDDQAEEEAPQGCEANRFERVLADVTRQVLATVSVLCGSVLAKRVKSFAGGRGGVGGSGLHFVRSMSGSILHTGEVGLEILLGLVEDLLGVPGVIGWNGWIGVL